MNDRVATLVAVLGLLAATLAVAYVVWVVAVVVFHA